jgi:hypothetical protein
MFTFNRGIDPRFVDRLNAEYERGGWWRAIACDRDMFVAIRDGYLNVYWNGCSILQLFLNGEKLLGKTHYKYLLRSNLPKPYVQIDDGVVQLPDPATLFHSDLSDVPALKRAAAAYVGEEKKGVHQIVLSNPNVIDVEVTFGIEGNETDGPATRRIDFAALRPAGDGSEICFYEAKDFTNKELRAKGDDIPVLNQIEGYRKLLIAHGQGVMRSYRAVCGNLTALQGVRERYAAALDQMQRLASGEANLSVNEAVRLVVFGFDGDQKEGKVWTDHNKKLGEALNGHLLLRGHPKGFTRGIST